MNFEMHTPPGVYSDGPQKGQPYPARLCVRICVGKDEVFRPATDADKAAYQDEYAAFLAASAPPAAVEPAPPAPESPPDIA